MATKTNVVAFPVRPEPKKASNLLNPNRPPGWLRGEKARASTLLDDGGTPLIYLVRNEA